MIIDSDLVKKLRAAKPWSQEQLSQASNLNLRTVQRLENTGKASLESVRALAAAFEVDPEELILIEKDERMTPFTAFKAGFIQFANFTDTSTRFEYWWFFIFVLLILGIADIINEQLLQIVAIIMLVPFLAAGTRRLNDIEQSGWWQLLFLVPFGFVPVLYMMALDSKVNESQPAPKRLDVS